MVVGDEYSYGRWAGHGVFPFAENSPGLACPRQTKSSSVIADEPRNARKGEIQKVIRLSIFAHIEGIGCVKATA